MPKSKIKKKKKSPKRNLTKSARDKSPKLRDTSNPKDDDLTEYVKAINTLNWQPLNIKTADLKSVTPVKEQSVEEEEIIIYKWEPSPIKQEKVWKPVKYSKVSNTAASIIQKYWWSRKLKSQTYEDYFV